MRAEAEVSRRDQDLTVARTSLQLQETLMKNAITKSLDDPGSGSHARDSHRPDADRGNAARAAPIADLISAALHSAARARRI